MVVRLTRLSNDELHNSHYRGDEQRGKNDAGGNEGHGIAFLKIPFAVLLALNTYRGRQSALYNSKCFGVHKDISFSNIVILFSS